MMRFMKKAILIRAFFVALLSGFLLPSGSLLAAALEGRVTHVFDGDSIIVKTDHERRVEVRLANIDAPEITKTKGRRRMVIRQGQPFGEEARNALRTAIFRKRIRVDVLDVDQYGRIVGVVYRDGRNINLEMVERGYAWAYRSRLHRPYVSDYIEAEREARARGYGLWRQANPHPPWEFRRKMRAQDNFIVR
jgi:endonuclease YncB( thermonuclease family)